MKKIHSLIVTPFLVDNTVSQTLHLVFSFSIFSKYSQIGERFLDGVPEFSDKHGKFDILDRKVSPILLELLEDTGVLGVSICAKKYIRIITLDSIIIFYLNILILISLLMVPVHKEKINNYWQLNIRNG